MTGPTLPPRRWDLLPHALALVQSKIKQSEKEAFEAIKILVADGRVQARGPWPREGLNGNPRPKGRAHPLPAESFHYAELTRDGEGVFFLDLTVTIPWVEVDVDQLRRAGAAAEAAPANSGGRKRHGRPPDTSMARADAPYLKSMTKLVEEGLTPTKAAWKVVRQDGSGVPGPADPESKVRRLVRRLKNGE